MDVSCSFREDEEEDEFFDSREDMGLGTEYDYMSLAWSSGLRSVEERRRNFVEWMGLDLIGHCRLSSTDDRVMFDGGAAVRPSVSDEECGSCIARCPGEEQCASRDVVLEGNKGYQRINLDDGIVSISDELRNDGRNKACLNCNVARDNNVSLFMSREDNTLRDCHKTLRRRKKVGWLRRLAETACILSRHVSDVDSGTLDFDGSVTTRVQRVRVRPYRKRVKELSAVYTEQDIKAHRGAIFTMKFSHDGRYLASGGDDSIVCVWLVVECARTDEGDIPKDDPSCAYFAVNQNSTLSPLNRDKEKKEKSMSMRRTPDSACVIIPSDTFQLSERPLHIFQGHDGHVLDLSWSKNKYLLSSSTDKTVRLWQVGCDRCLKVFSHNNYVTCVQFNPVNERYFISGSIDGKIRIWEIHECQVVDWIDIKEIVTAVCYRPDGKGGVVGFMSGGCHFFDATDNHLKLDAEISLQGKKKSPCKRITGFQYSPSDNQILMVTSADSQIRILGGTRIICKYKGLRNAGSQISASFTSDGRHIISASEDSYVYVWSHTSKDHPISERRKSVWSCERFISSNVSVAVPWHGLESRNPVTVTSENSLLQSVAESCTDFLGNKPSHNFILNPDFFSELLPKGHATWPEEKLSINSMTKTVLHKSHYKFLKTSCQNMAHEWGRVIVTAGWDGRIRLFRNYGLPVLT